MRVSPITNVQSQNVRKNNNPSFQNYRQVFHNARYTKEMNFNEFTDMFSALISMAKHDPLAKKTKYAGILDGDMDSILKDARLMKKMYVPLIQTDEPYYDFVRLNYGSIEFLDPKKPNYCDSCIDVSISKSGNYRVNRRDYADEFYRSGLRKSFFEWDHGCLKRTFYKKDGSKNILRNMLEL